MKGCYIVGIDTSCYTSSVAVVDHTGKVVIDERRALKVPEGKRGLKQSECVYQHVQNIPPLIEGICRKIDFKSVAGIAASTRPRPLKGSRMPVFTVSKGVGTMLASVLQVPFLPFSHQEGHLMAGIFSSGFKAAGGFLAVHLSGGTSELLRVGQSKEGIFEIEILGQSKDLYAGQFIDRVGVSLGLNFPAGRELEKLAQKCSVRLPLRIPSSVEGLNFSFSGPETHAQRMINRGEDPAAVARAVEQCVANTIEKVVRRAVLEYGIRDVLFVGGVMANTYIKNRLKKRLEHRAVGARLAFSQPFYSTDNAVGIALMGLQLLAGT